MGFIKKTDINGSVLWEKRIGNSSYLTSIQATTQTFDGGFISIGTTFKLDENGDAVIIKFDACGAKEWCKIYSVPSDIDDGISIVQLNNGNYVAMINYFGYNSYQRVWLFCLDPGGNLLWQKVYCQDNPELGNPWGIDLIINSDSGFMVSGTTTVEYPIGSGNWWGEPLLVKTDQDGTEIFAKAFEYNRLIYYGLGYRVAEDFQGNFFVASMNYYDQATLSSPGAITMFNSEGDRVTWFNLYAPPYNSGTCSTVNFISPDRMVLAGGYSEGFDSGFAMAYIMDTSGVLIKQKTLKFDRDGNVVQRTAITTDNKILMTAGFFNIATHKFELYLYKMNDNLDNDTIDPRILNYNSLCNNLPIDSDTIDLDCEVITGLDKPLSVSEKSQLMINPNPATETLTVKLPEYILNMYSESGIAIQTIKYLSNNDINIDIVNIYGHIIENRHLQPDEKIIYFYVGGWEKGLYIVHLKLENKIISSTKLIIN